MPTLGVTADVVKFDEASGWFTKRVVMTAVQARALDDRLKHEAFWVGGGLQIAQVQRVFDALEQAIENGTTLEEFQKAIKADLKNPAHVETVLRNATQRAYSGGRWAQMTEPDSLKLRPYWLYDSVLDSRVTELCKGYDGTLLPADDQWWNTRIPPLHHRCRSSIRNLRRTEAQKRGITAAPSTDAPKGGWGHAPGSAGSWKPDPSKYDAALIGALDGKAPKGTRTRRPRPKAEHRPDFYLADYRKRYGDAAPSLAHGKASLERGLDLTVAQVRAQLGKVDTPGVVAMLEALQDADPTRTVRSQGGELDPMRKAGAALAGHLDLIKKRPKVKHSALSKQQGGQKALDLLSVTTGRSVATPDDSWTFLSVRRGGATMERLKQVEYDREPGTLEHEIGHALEILNPALFDRSKAFLRARARGEQLNRHGSVAGIPVLAWDDSFLHHYTGRRYQTRQGTVFGTEITSTGLELLVANEAHWGTLSKLVQKDPEHFLFLLGQLAGP